MRVLLPCLNANGGLSDAKIYYGTLLAPLIIRPITSSHD